MTRSSLLLVKVKSIDFFILSIFFKMSITNLKDKAE